ncbi:helix-turn-helix domain-containing protein [Alteromonas oceanisediminis]|uniref:helix-turn-helix domain-containing protein n=1 Tax=Alteromonas oceanisediminis TaxID=2836180 RepID=UPI001BDA0046|nr:AraC family transcriptional regulator [Alteromonas oceanisediminis]MBT0587651.1 AraC family transcriptional regulator [Alteromonas oceanisediminis]
MMLFVDLLFRFTAVGMIVLIMLLAFRDLRRTTSFWLLIFTNLSLLCHYLGATPSGVPLPDELRIGLRLVDTTLLPITWLFTLSLYAQDFRVRGSHMLILLLVSGLMLAERMVYFGWLPGLPRWWPLLITITAFGLVSHMLWETWHGRHDDLIDKRRLSRTYVVVTLAVCIVIAIVLGSFIMPEQQHSVVAISLWPTLLLMAYWLFNISPTALTFQQQSQNTAVLSHRDQQLQSQLDDAMTQDKAYLDGQLTISTLSKRLGVSPTRLRAFINQQLGFTHFSHYINAQRIDAIKHALRRSDNAHIPILTIALNHGFNSLPPFNRAFKQQEGITPTEYRAKQRE